MARPHATPPGQRHGPPMLARNVTHFMRLLREAGFPLSPAHAFEQAGDWRGL